MSVSSFKKSPLRKVNSMRSKPPPEREKSLSHVELFVELRINPPTVKKDR
jgi:hypothetical protein